MRTRKRMLCLLVGLVTAGSSAAGEIAPDLAAVLENAPSHQRVRVIVTLREQVEPKDYPSDKRQLVRALRRQAERTQTPVRQAIASDGGSAIEPLWIVNAIAAEVPVRRLRGLASRADVARVRLDAEATLPPSDTSSAPPTWNLVSIHSDGMWAQGFDGAGTVIASLDSGADAAHPDLQPKWRGGANSWYDPYGQHATPADVHGHGTQTLGIMVGGDAGGTAIGVAPGAQWIAAKIFNDADTAWISAIHRAFQWVLDPDGDPDVDDAPDVVVGAWGLLASIGGCDGEFRRDIQALKAADIAVAFSAGNNGPDANTSVSPANYPDSYAVGAVDENLQLAAFSARGPSSCDGGLYPHVVAPGVNIRTADLTFGGVIPNPYVTVSGTSFSVAHVGGAIALLRSAVAQASVAELELALNESAADLGELGADYGYGWGLLDVTAAYQRLLESAPPPVDPATLPTAADDAYSTAEDTLLDVAAPGVLGNDDDPNGNPLAAVLVDNVSHGTLTLNADGSFSYTPATDFHGSDGFTYQASNGSGSSPVTRVDITVNPVNDPPVAASESYSVAMGSSLSVAAPGVLANDSDIDGDPLSAVLISPTTGGTLTLAADGSFSYAPNVGTASDSFSYTPFDGMVQGAPVTVSIAVVSATNAAPVAGDDYASTRRGATINIPVLANDSDADGSLVPASVTVTAAPSQGGTVSVNSDGSVTYTPVAGFQGTDVFTYTVSDDDGAVSNEAVVRVSARR